MPQLWLETERHFDRVSALNTGANFDAELEEFAMDPGGTPQWVSQAHFTDHGRWGLTFAAPVAT
jgi:hypothetical protein